MDWDVIWAESALADVEDSADLTIQFGIPARVTAGTSYLAYGQLRNAGPDTAENVNVVDTLPASVGIHYFHQRLSDARGNFAQKSDLTPVA